MVVYLYQIQNNINKKIYVGIHKSESLDDDYMGSGKIIKQAIRKTGIQNFTKTVLETFDNYEDALKREGEIVNEDFLSRPDVYNLKLGGTGGWDYIIKNNLHKTSTGQAPWNKGKKTGPMTDDHKQRISETLKTRYQNQTHHLKGKPGLGKGSTGQAPWNKGKKTGPMTDDHKQRISETLKTRYQNQTHHLKGKPGLGKGSTGQAPWNKGVKSPRIDCEYCGKNIDVLNYKKWHGEKCKTRKTYVANH